MKKIVCFLFIFFFLITGVSAQGLEIEDVILKDKSSDVSYTVNFDNDKIDSNITFKNINDYIVYTIKLNNSKTIKSINDNNSNEYIKTSYEYDNSVNLKLEYIKENYTAGFNNSFDIIITYDDDTTSTISVNNNDEIDESFISLINPKTMDDVIKYIVLFSISIIGMIICIKHIKNKKILSILIITLLICPIGVFALTNEKIKFNTSYNFIDDYKNISIVYGDATNKDDILSFNDEGYYVINYDEETKKITLIPKYNLKLENNLFKQDNSDINEDAINPVEFNNNIYSLLEQYKEQLVKEKMIGRKDIVRLITLDDLDNIGYSTGNRENIVTTTNAPYYIYTSTYWTNDSKDDKKWVVNKGGKLDYKDAAASNVGFRPVIEIYLSEVKEKKLESNYAPVYSSWFWNNSLDAAMASEQTMDDSINIMKELGIQEVYLSILPANLENQRELTYMKKLYDNNIKYYALYGDPNFVNPINDYYDVIDFNLIAIKNFNDKYLGQAHIEGIHYDVEYFGATYDGEHTCDGGESEENIRCVSRNNFVNFVRLAYERAQNYNLKIQHDLNIYATNFASYYPNNGDVKSNVFDDIIDYADDFVVMAYGRTDDDTINYMETTEFRFDDWTTAYPGKGFAQKLKEHNKRGIVGQDLGTVKSMAQNVEDDPNRYASWVPEYGVDYKYNFDFVNSMHGKVISRLESNGYENVLIAVHDYYGLVDLYNSRN